jgi:hypothetical protein
MRCFTIKISPAQSLRAIPPGLMGTPWFAGNGANRQGSRRVTFRSANIVESGACRKDRACDGSVSRSVCGVSAQACPALGVVNRCGPLQAAGCSRQEYELRRSEVLTGFEWRSCRRRAGRIGARGDDGSSERPAERSRLFVRGDPDGDGAVFTPQPSGNPGAGGDDPGDRPRPGGHEFFPNSWDGKLQKRLNLLELGGDQNQSLGSRPLFQCQQSVDRCPVEGVAAQTVNSLGGIGDQPPVAQMAYCEPQSETRDPTHADAWTPAVMLGDRLADEVALVG